MMDQAEKLRKIAGKAGVKDIVSKLKEKTTKKNDSLKFKGSKEAIKDVPKSESVEKKKAKILTVSSGKGGVGKTNFTINLALSLMKEGFRVVILDADFGLANIEVALGATPKFTLLDVLENRKNILEVIQNAPNNVRFISGGSGITKLSKVSREDLDVFTKNMGLLDSFFDVVLVDTGAGISDNVLNFILAADDVFLITTPEPTSITDAYALLKLIAGSKYEKEINLVINRTRGELEGIKVFHNLLDVTQKFLGIKIKLLGHLDADIEVERAVKTQTPFIISAPKAKVSRQIKEMAKKIIEKDLKEGKEETFVGARSFFDSFIKKFRGDEDGV